MVSSLRTLYRVFQGVKFCGGGQIFIFANVNDFVGGDIGRGHAVVWGGDNGGGQITDGGGDDDKVTKIDVFGTSSNKYH